MSVLTQRTATCDTCGEKQEFGLAGDVPDGWQGVWLFRRIDDNSRQVHHLDLCPRCQEIALDALRVK